MLGNVETKHFYRRWVRTKDLYRTHICVEETDIDILADVVLDKKFLKERVVFYRNQIKDYISKDRRFLVELKPLNVGIEAVPIVKDMASASRIAGVGPMAAVAGAIAQYLGKDILERGTKEIIVENGGDIFLNLQKTRLVCIYAGKTKFSGKLFLKIKPQSSIKGICTSSATVGHSLSFGEADAVTILAEDAILADAMATAVCNRIKTEGDFEDSINFAKKTEGVIGLVIILKDKLASWGKVEFV